MRWATTLLFHGQLGAALLCAAPRLALGQEPQLRDMDRPWLGCWRIRLEDSVPDLARGLLVRLDSTPTYRGPPPHYYGRHVRGVTEADTSPYSLSWASPTADSLWVTIIGLGGYGWHFQRDDDSLRGSTYLYYDAIPEESVVGRVSARRAACP